MSVGTAGIPKHTHSSNPVPELITLSVALTIMGIALWGVWAAYTITEPLEAAASTVSPEVVADAAGPPEVVALTAVSPEAMAPAAVSPEVAAHAAESPKTAALASIPYVVVEPSNALSACYVAVNETVTEPRIYPVKENVNEFSLFPDASVTTTSAISELSASVETPDVTAVEPPQVAASAAEPLEVSVVSTYQLSTCPVTVKETL